MERYLGQSSTLKELFPSLFRIALLPQGSVVDHWDHSTLSWSLSFRRSLQEEEIVAFGSFLDLLALEKVFDFDDLTQRFGQLDSNVDSLLNLS